MRNLSTVVFFMLKTHTNFFLLSFFYGVFTGEQFDGGFSLDEVRFKFEPKI